MPFQRLPPSPRGSYPGSWDTDYDSQGEVLTVQRDPTAESARRCQAPSLVLHQSSTAPSGRLLSSYTGRTIHARGAASFRTRSYARNARPYFVLAAVARWTPQRRERLKPPGQQRRHGRDTRIHYVCNCAAAGREAYNEGSSIHVRASSMQSKRWGCLKKSRLRTRTQSTTAK